MYVFINGIGSHEKRYETMQTIRFGVSNFLNENCDQKWKFR